MCVCVCVCVCVFVCVCVCFIAFLVAPLSIGFVCFMCECVCTCGLDWWHMGDDVAGRRSGFQVWRHSVTTLSLLPLLVCEQDLGTLRIHLQNFATGLLFNQIRSGC